MLVCTVNMLLISVTPTHVNKIHFVKVLSVDTDVFVLMESSDDIVKVVICFEFEIHVIKLKMPVAKKPKRIFL